MKGKPKWVTAWVPNITDIVYGKILSITHYPNYSTPVSYPEHWKYQNVSSNPQPRTPCSQTITIVPCQGCSQHFSYYVGNLKPKCIIQIKHLDLIVVDTLTKKKNNWQSLLLHRDIILYL
ncbi:ribonuclease H-like domain-containing protein [Rhizophagus irregularis DAOM 181602=DAOM 197198]|nr:ribonuclease H-like domain-containing protein [Rhizophagus irregularis DAOM 181602=DAOM 197198]